jgi:hypothetical protein
VKKELFAASLLAVGLAVGLGTISFGLFAEAPSAGKLETVLDVYTLKGGIGINVTGGTFEPGDSAPIYAYLTVGGVPVNGSQVMFTIKKPEGTENIGAVLTNGSGVAEISLSFLPSEGHLIGAWQILANASVNNDAVSDTMMLELTFFLRKMGQSASPFSPAMRFFWRQNYPTGISQSLVPQLLSRLERQMIRTFSGPRDRQFQQTALEQQTSRSKSRGLQTSP